MAPLVVLTRPEGKNSSLASRLENQGLSVLQLPVLKLEPVLSSAVPNPADFDLVFFVSGFAVQCYFDSLESRLGCHIWPRDVWAAAVGETSAKALLQTKKIDISQIIAPPSNTRQDSEALWDTLQNRALSLKRVLIVGAESGRNWLTDRFSQAGIIVQRYCAYERTIAQWTPEQQGCLRASMHDCASHRAIALLTSRYTVDAWFACIQRAGMIAQLRYFDYVVIHERIAGHLQQTLVEMSPNAKSSIIVSKPDDNSMFQSIMTLATPAVFAATGQGITIQP